VFQWKTLPMPARQAVSPRREELLDRSYEYVLANGLSELSLRPLAAAVGSSPGVLLFLFGSKEQLVRAILRRARADEIARLEEARASDPARGFAAGARSTWQWLVDANHRALLVLWLEVYALSVADPDGPWTGFAEQTVEEWLDLLAGGQQRPSTKKSAHERTLCLAVLRGALLDLLATGDTDRVGAAVERYLGTLRD
jgi:AcrR family transcriptional regulator